jgi:serine/threonine protein kinase
MRLADRYVLHDPPIGAGGMGTVWRAYDELLQREVAVKELRLPDGLSAAEREALRERAMVEARAAASLHHPGIVPVHDVLEEDGRPWIVMHLVQGMALDQEVATAGPLSPQRTAEIGLQLLDALSAAHANGILHRDVKPQNILLDNDGRALLTDFGIAALVGATRGLTQDDSLVGTLGYVAPERTSGAKAAPASDLWSLGATLYYAVAGQPAYRADDPAAVVAAVLTRDPDPPQQAGPLWPVIHGLLARDPEQRLGVEEARKRLRAVAAGPSTPPDAPTFETPTTRLPGPDADPEQDPPDRRRITGRAALVAAGAVLAVAGVVVAILLLRGLPDGSATAKDSGPTTTATATDTASPTKTTSPSPTPPRALYRLAPNVCKGMSEKSPLVEQLVPQASPNYSEWKEVSKDVTCEWETLKKGNDYFEWPMFEVSAKHFASDKKAAEDFSWAYIRHERDDVIEPLTDLGDEAFFAHKSRGFPYTVVVNVRSSNVTVTVTYEYEDRELAKAEKQAIVTFARQLVKKAEAEAN